MSRAAARNAAAGDLFDAGHRPSPQPAPPRPQGRPQAPRTVGAVPEVEVLVPDAVEVLEAPLAPASPALPKGPVLIVATVLDAAGIDEHGLGRAMHGAAVEGLRRAGLAGKAVRLTVHAEVVP